MFFQLLPSSSDTGPVCLVYTRGIIVALILDPEQKFLRYRLAVSVDKTHVATDVLNQLPIGGHHHLRPSHVNSIGPVPATLHQVSQTD